MTAFIQNDPTAEPISLQEAKDHLRYGGTDDDELIRDLISAARQRCEAETRTVIADCSCQMIMDGFPSYGSPIILTRRGIKSVSGISYRSINPGSFSGEFSGGFVGSEVAVSPDDYQVDLAGGRVIPLKSWPQTAGAFASVTVSMTGGSAPICVKRAMLLIVGALYENREDISDRQTFRIALSASNLLAPIVHGSYP